MRLRGLPVIVVLVPVLATGCGRKETPRVSVSGSVTLGKQALPVGTVTFIGEDNNVVESAPIKDGQYTIARAPVGPVKITVTTPGGVANFQIKQKVEGKTFEGSAPDKIPPIPEKYKTAAKTDLTYTVTAEKTQTHDIELK